MPRIAREISQSGIYHVMLRGTNRQEIFHDDKDCISFLDTLDRYKKTSKMKVLGWCLMGNHVHLLLQEAEEGLSITMKRIGVSYAWYYNNKYKTTGHLFQDRFKSEKIENDGYLTTVIRYIHQNPVKAGMVKQCSQWNWSSCRQYYGIDNSLPLLLDEGPILGVFSDNIVDSISKFKEFNESINEDIFLDDTIKTRLTDEEAVVLFKSTIREYELPEIKALPRFKRNELIACIKELEGVTQRQISRVLGIPLSLVNRA